MNTDKKLIDYSNKLTRYLIDYGININKVVFLVKDYQKNYYDIKNSGCSHDILELYSPVIWWQENVIDGKLIVTTDNHFNIGIDK